MSVFSYRSYGTIVDTREMEKLLLENEYRCRPVKTEKSWRRSRLLREVIECFLCLQMAPGCGGGTGGDSSESHDTDQPGDELDSPPAVRRRGHHPSKGATSRPHSDLLNQILIDKFKVSSNYLFILRFKKYQYSNSINFT